MDIIKNILHAIFLCQKKSAVTKESIGLLTWLHLMPTTWLTATSWRSSLVGIKGFFTRAVHFIFHRFVALCRTVTGKQHVRTVQLDSPTFLKINSALSIKFKLKMSKPVTTSKVMSNLHSLDCTHIHFAYNRSCVTTFIINARLWHLHSLKNDICSMYLKLHLKVI